VFSVTKNKMSQNGEKYPQNSEKYPQNGVFFDLQG
jgi:hypothetical protein